MAEKSKCSQCHEREVFSKGLCSGCYGKEWRLARKESRAMVIPDTSVKPRQLTDGVIEGEIVHDEAPPRLPETHIVATDPVEMKAAQDDVRAWAEQKLAVIERDITEANAALNEARKNGWATSALTSARNRAVDDETFYNKILAAVESGYTIIPDFPIQVFAVRQHEQDRPRSITYQGSVSASDTGLAQPIESDCPPAGAGEYRNPQPWISSTARENKSPGAQERGEPRYYTSVYRSGGPIGPIIVPPNVARSTIMKSIAGVMKEKVFDQVGVCHPVIADVATAARRVDTRARRAGDPLVIGQVLRKRVGGGPQKCVNFIIAWYLNLDEL